MTRDYEAEVEQAIRLCRECARTTPEARAAHKEKALREILAKQSQPPAQLPDSIWPNGRFDLPQPRKKTRR